MLTTIPTSSVRTLKRQSGVSLIIVMIMVVIIGLTSAAAIRSATSGEKLTNNIRMQNLAQQYAEAALRYCEAEVSKADGVRVATLKDAVIPTTAYVVNQATFQTAPHWANTVSWTGAAGSGAASSTRTVVPVANLVSLSSSLTPSTRPECVAERQGMAGATTALVITARGFSPDYVATPVTGVTANGSVVWLQSILLF